MGKVTCCPTSVPTVSALLSTKLLTSQHSVVAACKDKSPKKISRKLLKLGAELNAAQQQCQSISNKQMEQTWCNDYKHYNICQIHTVSPMF